MKKNAWDNPGKPLTYHKFNHTNNNMSDSDSASTPMDKPLWGLFCLYSNFFYHASHVNLDQAPGLIHRTDATKSLNKRSQG